MGKLNRYLVIALVLQGVILLISQVAGGPKATVKPKKLFDKLDVEKVTWLRIEEGGDEEKKKDRNIVELAKEDGRWVLKSGGDYPAKKDKITELLGKLPGLTATQPVSTSKGHHRKLEVADDKFQRKVAVRVGDTFHRFILGSSPGIKNVHLRLEGKVEVYVVKDITAWDAAASPSDWVQTDYFKVERDGIVELALTNKNGEIKLAKGPDGKWALEGMEEGATLKQTEVDSLLGSVSSIALQEPVGRVVEPAYELAAGQAGALLKLVVEKKAKQPKPKPGEPPASMPTMPPSRVTHALTVGAKKDDKYYVKSGGSQFVVKVASWAAEPLVNKKPSDLWEKKKEEGSEEGKAEEKTGP